MVRKVDEPEPNEHLRHWKITKQAKQLLQAEKRREEKKIQKLKLLTQASISQSSFGIVALPFSAGTERQTSRPER